MFCVEKQPSFLLPLLTAVALAIGWLSCRTNVCPPFEGVWQTEEGHTWVFEGENRLLWITRFGSVTDTMHLAYRYDCSRIPATLDLIDFDSGPWQGKTLYGIVEQGSDTTFRFCAAAGTAPSARPEVFDPTETVRFFRKRE